MTWVKICGITNLEDAMVAVDAGAGAVGFVFYEKSPRKVDTETACAIVEELPKRVGRVGGVVDGVDLDWLEMVHAAGMTAVQHVITGTPRESSSTGVDLSLLPQPP